MTTCACGNCQFFDTESAAVAKRKENESGLCRYNPPLAQPAGHSLGMWPVVGQADWCGHFAATVERFTRAVA